MKLILKFLLPILILIASVGAFTMLKATKPEQPAAQIEERIWRVDVMEVQPRTLTPALTLYGRLESPNPYKAAASAASRIDRVMVREGERVTVGQLLATLDERDFLPRLDQARADVLELEAEIRSEGIRQQSDMAALTQEKKLLQVSRQGVDRAQRLRKKDLGSDSALDEAERALATQALSLTSRELAIADHPARLSALEARLARARARVTELELEFERSRLLAPFDGIVAEVKVAEGDQVNKNAVLLTLYDPGALEVRARIPAPFQEELDQVRKTGKPLSGEVIISGRRLELRLLRLAGEASPSGVDALFKFESRPEWLRPGQVIRFDIRRLPQPDAVSVPFQALYRGNRVYRLQDGRMRGVGVETLGIFTDASGKERQLVRGAELKAGDYLVTTHLPNAVDGLRAEAVAGE